MKKIILSIIAVCMAAATVSAQDFSYGVKAGLNIANFGKKGDKVDDSKSRQSFLVGVMGDYKLSEQMALSAELLYSAQGDKNKNKNGGDKSVTKMNLGYLNIPILFNYYVIDGLAVKAGVQPGFLLGAKYKSKITTDGVTTKAEAKAGEIVNTVDFAIPVGVSYDVTEKIMVDARYNIGVSNIFKDAPDVHRRRNNVFQLSVGYKF